MKTEQIQIEIVAGELRVQLYERDGDKMRWMGCCGLPVKTHNGILGQCQYSHNPDTTARSVTIPIVLKGCGEYEEFVHVDRTGEGDDTRTNLERNKAEGKA